MLDILQENENSWIWTVLGQNRPSSGLFGVYLAIEPDFELLDTSSAVRLAAKYLAPTLLLHLIQR